MRLIFKYLKKYIFLVIAVVALTFVQVQTELSLPDYMSDIVSRGIQFGGISEDYPLTISEDDMKTLKLFMSKEDVNKVDSLYEKNESNYVCLREDDSLKEVFSNALVYTYLCKTQDISVNESNIETVKNSLTTTINGLQDSYDNIIKLSIQNIYRNAGIDVENIQSSYIIKAGLMMLGISLIGVIAQLASTFLSSKVATKSAAEIRREIFTKVQSFSSSEFSKFSTASLITRTSNDVTKVQMLMQLMMRMMLMSPMMGITAVIKVMQYPQVSWILLVALGVILGALVVVLVLAVPKFSIIQKLTDSINNVMREFLDGMLPIRAFNAQKKEEEKFDKTNSEMTRIDRFVSRIMNGIMPLMTFIMNALTIAIIWISSKQIDMNTMSVGNMLAFLQYAMHVVISFMLVSALFFMIPRALVSAKRINEVLNTDITINDVDNPEELPTENGDLVFDNVTFRYPGAEENVLENISFIARPGETIAFIGSTGSGKSTVVKLIPRLFDVSEGKITYCGHDLRDVKQKDLRDRIGYATQKALLFKGTMESNIKFGRDVNEEDINKAVDIAQARDIVLENELGIKQEITQGGTNVSGGQKQRISIARTLALNKQIYIFDDTFSALDYATDKKLRSELTELIKKTKSTVIIVAQRIATIKNADKIIVLDSGKIVGTGTHKDLLKTCEVYKEIALSQLSKEELDNAF